MIPDNAFSLNSLLTTMCVRATHLMTLTHISLFSYLQKNQITYIGVNAFSSLMKLSLL